MPEARELGFRMGSFADYVAQHLQLQARWVDYQIKSKESHPFTTSKEEEVAFRFINFLSAIMLGMEDGEFSPEVVTLIKNQSWGQLETFVMMVQKQGYFAWEQPDHPETILRWDAGSEEVVFLPKDDYRDQNILTNKDLLTFVDAWSERLQRTLAEYQRKLNSG